MARSPRRALGKFILLIVVFSGICVFMVVQNRHERRSDRDHPAAAPPADLCAVLDAAAVERMVPRPVRDDGGAYSSTTPANGDARCAYDTARDGAGDDRYGSLTVRVLRHGQVSGLSGTGRADKAYEEVCASLQSSIPGQAGAISGSLGDEACLMVDSGSSGTVFGYLRVRRGADLIWVDYYVHPGTVQQVESAVADVSREVFGAL